MEIDKIKRVALGVASDEERAEVRRWVGTSDERQRFVKVAVHFYNGVVESDDVVNEYISKMWQKIHLNRKRNILAIYSRWVAAAACIVAVAGLFLWRSSGCYTGNLPAIVTERAVDFT